MSQIQFLILVTAAIPLLNLLALQFGWNLGKIFSVLFLANLIGLYSTLETESVYVSLVRISPELSLGFFVDKIVLGFLFLLSFLWLIFVFYSRRFLDLFELKNSYQFQSFFISIIASINFIILSKNLLTLLLFYNLLILLSYFFAVKFLHKAETIFSRLFMFLLYLESVFFFLAIVATYKFSSSIEFSNTQIIADNFDPTKYRLLFLLFVAGLFASVLAPFYLLYRSQINLEPLILYVFFFLGYAISSLLIFIRIIASIFGTKTFSLILGQVGFGFFEIVFLLNILLASGLLLMSKGIKSSFFYLFFQQLTFVLFSIFFFENFSPSRVYIALCSFLLEFTLLFLAISNLILYLTQAQNKNLDGLFYKLIVTCSLLLFALGSMAGIAPSIGLVEKFFLFKTAISEKQYLSLSILITNSLSLLLFGFKIFRPLFWRQVDGQNEADNELAKNIDFDSSLILTGLTVAVLMFLGLVLFPFLTNF